jgi:hypothetical protein
MVDVIVLPIIRRPNDYKGIKYRTPKKHLVH